MANIILLRGTPLSGKTTFAQKAVLESNGTLKLVSKDALRHMCDTDNRFGNTQAKEYTELRDQLISFWTKRFYNVIVDETFARFEDIYEVRKKFIFDSPWNMCTIYDMPLLSLDELIDRDRERAERIGRRIGAEELAEYHRLITEWPTRKYPSWENQRRWEEEKHV
jgi:tRNA uridine 5-carbamoylmethylation protein Kti12